MQTEESFEHLVEVRRARLKGSTPPRGPDAVAGAAEVGAELLRQRGLEFAPNRGRLRTGQTEDGSHYPPGGSRGGGERRALAQFLKVAEVPPRRCIWASRSMSAACPRSHTRAR